MKNDKNVPVRKDFFVWNEPVGRRSSISNTGNRPGNNPSIFPFGGYRIRHERGVGMRRMQDLPAIDRPREKIARAGAGILSDRELVAAIIGRGTKGCDVLALSERILQIIRDMPDGGRFCELAAIQGMGPARAAQIEACCEFGRRLFAEDRHCRITRPEDVLPSVEGLREKKQEHFVCLTLSGAGEVIGNRIVTVGLLNHSLVHPREVFADAIADRAASIICVHNHPSGSLEPSEQDLAITGQLAHAGEILGIRLIDHLIITRKGHFSMREHGLLQSAGP
jgi:DNA repair protein RadC